MWRRRTIIAGAFILLLLKGIQAQTPTVQVEEELNGSVPPIPDLYACARQLKGKPFDKDQAEKCLASILAEGFFKEGRIRTKREGDKVSLTFVLSAPELMVTAFEFDTAADYSTELRPWVERHPVALQLGDVYTVYRESLVPSAIELFL